MKIDVRQFAGPQAASAKYDVLTALSMIAFARGGAAHISVLRMIGLVTARYNWRLDELCVCQRDMARMWGVTERTAKREVKAWVDGRLMIRTRVGVRGRAGAYRLDLVEIREQAAPLWSRVGPDYVERMAPVEAVDTQNEAHPDIPERSDVPALPGTWAAASRRLRVVDHAVHAAWIEPLNLSGDDGTTIRLTAPSRFAAHYLQTHLMRRISEAVEAEIGPGRRIEVVAST